MHRLPIVGLACALALVTALPSLAVDWKTLKPQGYVSDFAQVIDPQSRQAIESYCALVQQKTGAQLAFVTIPTLQGESIEDVAVDLFRDWGVGKKGEDNGAMMLLSIQDHKSRLEVGFGLGAFVPDGMAGLLLDDMRPALRQNQYGPAFLTAAERLGSTIAQAKNVSLGAPQAVPQTRRVRRTTRDSIPWPLILFGLFILFAIFRGGGNRRGGGGGGGGFLTGMILGNLLGGGGRSYGGSSSGGGFGGYDSGDSGGGFGGFGGGDSGGGGASSDW